MTTQTNQPPIHNVMRPQAAVVSQAGGSKSSPSKTALVDVSGKTGIEPVASLEISEVGREMATHLTHKVSTQEAAKEQLDVIHKQLQARPETIESVHSNLRALRINHLIYD